MKVSPRDILKVTDRLLLQVAQKSNRNTLHELALCHWEKEYRNLIPDCTIGGKKNSLLLFKFSRKTTFYILIHTSLAKYHIDSPKQNTPWIGHKSECYYICDFRVSPAYIILIVIRRYNYAEKPIRKWMVFPRETDDVLWQPSLGTVNHKRKIADHLSIWVLLLALIFTITPSKCMSLLYFSDISEWIIFMAAEKWRNLPEGRQNYCFPMFMALFRFHNSD